MVSLNTIRTIKRFSSQLIRNGGEVKSALVTVTTKCNAKCVEKCDMWKQKPVEMSWEDTKTAIDFLAKNGYSILYFTGGEPSLWRHLVEGVAYAKSRGLITSLTTNGTISIETLEKLANSLDVLSVSVDHYNLRKWDELKRVDGISKKTVDSIRTAKKLGMNVYAMTYLDPELTKKPGEIEKMVRYVNYNLGISSAWCFPFSSGNQSTFCVGEGEVQEYLREDSIYIEEAVEKILQLKLSGSTIATPAAYMRDVIRAYEGREMKYPCRAGSSVISIDYNLDVYPCFKKGKIFNIRENPDYNPKNKEICRYDGWNCLINCFKEPSSLSRGKIWLAVIEELFSNPSFYLNLILPR